MLRSSAASVPVGAMRVVARLRVAVRRNRRLRAAKRRAFVSRLVKRSALSAYRSPRSRSRSLALPAHSHFFLVDGGLCDGVGLSLLPPSNLLNNPPGPFTVVLSLFSSRMFATRTSRAASKLFGLIETTRL
jgi:hypothetical protein